LPTGRLVGVSMLTPRQLRAARVLVNWTRKDLAAKAGGSAVAIEHFERGLSSPKLVTASRWRRALEKAGVIFIDADDHAGPGVRLKTRPKD
jgi:transcriptional regulator with XRE-family HTH domain